MDDAALRDASNVVLEGRRDGVGTPPVAVYGWKRACGLGLTPRTEPEEGVIGRPRDAMESSRPGAGPAGAVDAR